jgi:two-component system, NtrC family, sensor histidine kinase HydH
VPERRTNYLDPDIRPGGVAVVGSNYKLVFINEVFCKKLGYEKADLAGTSLIDITYPAEQEKCKRLLVQAAQDKEAAYNSDLSFVSKNGETLRTKVTITAAGAHCEAAGRIMMTVENFIAPSRSGTSSENRRLAQIDASTRIFVHEFRNQMHTISLIALSIEQESVHRGLLKDDPLMALNQDLTRRLKDLDRLMQDLNRLDQSVKLKCQPTDLAKFLTTMLRSEQAWHIAAGRIRINADLARDVPLIELDRHRFKQVWLNLFKNAVEAMPSGGTITVRLYGSDAHVCLEIEDTGTGVPEGIDVFKPFVTTKPQGTGLGLGIVREIVSAHGGIVSYQSTPQAGAIFTISLPLPVPRQCAYEPT